MDVIHNLNRPFEELMLGFEAWIPIYMTGQLSPYHLPDYHDEVFHQINYCSGNAALFGECIEDSHADGRYYLTNNKSDLAYYRKKTNNILKHAKPLMDIYDYKNRSDFQAFENRHRKECGNRHYILSSLPVYTMPEELLREMIREFSPQEQESILQDYRQSKKEMAEILHFHHVLTEIPLLSPEEFKKTPMRLSFSRLYLPQMVTYRYDQYVAHREATIQYAARHENYTIRESDIIPFHNIDICTVENKYFIVSKRISPTIHFVIRHPTMVAAMNHLVIAKTDS